MDLFNQNTADMRLQNCVIRIGAEPIWVYNIEQRNNDFTLFYRVLGSSKDSLIFFSDESINIKPVPLGFINYRDELFNILRMPRRTYKIGLCAQNVHLLTLHGSTALRSRILISSALRKTIKNEYPTLNKARRELNAHSYVAFSRDFALRSDGYIVHRFLGKVGIMQIKPRLYDKYYFLKESLEMVT